jgi:hypothetical protein
MNLSQEVRNTLAKSGDRMSVAQITDALGGLADKAFVGAICSQHAKSGAFGRAVEDGRLVYWMVSASVAPAANIEPVDEPIADTPVVHPEASISSSAPVNKPQGPTKKTTALSDAIADLARSDAELQAERIERTERTSHSIARMLTHLLSDAIDANLEHDVLRRISSAQMAVQDVHGYLANLR